MEGTAAAVPWRRSTVYFSNRCSPPASAAVVRPAWVGPPPTTAGFFLGGARRRRAAGSGAGAYASAGVRLRLEIRRTFPTGIQLATRRSARALARRSRFMSCRSRAEGLLPALLVSFRPLAQEARFLGDPSCLDRSEHASFLAVTACFSFTLLQHRAFAREERVESGTHCSQRRAHNPSGSQSNTRYHAFRCNGRLS